MTFTSGRKAQERKPDRLQAVKWQNTPTHNPSDTLVVDSERSRKSGVAVGFSVLVRCSILIILIIMML